jgi:4'-phosphopantetheinyl transferase
MQPIQLFLGDSSPDVFILRLPLDQGGELSGLLASMCSENRRVQADRYRLRDDRIRCLAAGWLLDYAATKITGDGAMELKDALGKPMLKNLPHLQVSLAHSGEWVVCALHNAAVGIDVEIEVDTTEGAAELFMSPKELLTYRTLVDDPARRALFYHIWTMKESYLKAVGAGFARSPHLVDLDIQDNLLRVVDSSEELHPVIDDWSCYCSYLAGDAAKLALCWK